MLVRRAHQPSTADANSKATMWRRKPRCQAVTIHPAPARWSMRSSSCGDAELTELKGEVVVGENAARFLAAVAPQLAAGDQRSALALRMRQHSCPRSCKTPALDTAKRR